jgi:hypothetical protein
MALETVAVETFALRAISRISISWVVGGYYCAPSYHDVPRRKLENVFQVPTLEAILGRHPRIGMPSSAPVLSR